ncbi:MAG: zeta toxin family protein [Oscillospiraceae bacterium]|nr:zeta toxin family protein [Oscillospiraceae bacterium]
MTTLANTLSDFVIMGDRSEYNLAVKDYIAAGESQEDAKRHALTDWLTGLALDVAAGAISGGVTSGVSIGAGAAHSKVQESVVGWKEKESLHYLLTIDRALNYPESSETRKLAENLAARLDNATTLSEAKITDGEIGKLVKLMGEEESQLEKSDETNTRSAVNPVSAFRAANNVQTATEQPETVTENAPEPVVVSPTAAAFEAEGISTEDAMERAKILDALLAGEQVSNSQLEKLGSIKDKAGQAAFTAVTGEQIPASVTASGLRKFYRETAAKYAETQKMTADAKESAQQAEADQAVADAAARMETDPAAAFRPPLDTAEQTQYNKKGRSPEVTSIINRLNEGEVPLDEVLEVPKIKEAIEENDSATPTNELPNRKAIQDAAYEQAMAQGSFNGTDYSGPVRRERRIDIVLGLPGSGKSSVYTERISQENGSRVVDTDDYREYIPEYNGQNAGVVHEEASLIKNRVLETALDNGDNIILSTIGANAQKLERDIINYNAAGYSVHLHLNELPNHKAMARAIGRFLPEDGSQGRFVSPKVIAEYGDKPTQTYLYLTGRSDINGIHTEDNDAGGVQGAESEGGSGRGERAPGLREGRGYDQRGRAQSGGKISRTPAGAEIASYDWYNNDVEFGQPPILVESSDAKAKGGAINAGTESGVSTEGRTGTAAEGADSDGDTGARLDVIRSGDDSEASQAGELGRGGTGVHGVIRLSETEKRIITDSGNAVVELEDFTAEPAVFSSALTAAREADARNGWAVSPQDAESLAERNVTLLMSEDGGAGLGVTPGGDIIGVFKNPQSGGRGALYTLLPTALANGGVKLDCYGENLVDLYSGFGFIPVARVKFNAEYANPGWTPEKGEPEIYFMRHNGASAEQSLTDAIARKKRGDTNPIFPQEYLDALPEMSYEEAEAYRDALIEKKIKLDDGTELTREEFGEQIRKIVPDATELEIDTAFVEGLESSETVETEEISAEGHTERVIAENAAEELIGDVRGAEYVTVGEGIKLSRGQMWLAKFLANSLRKTGVVERVEITDKFGANIEGAIQNDVLYLNPKNVTPSYIAQKTIGHELFHAAVNKITKNAVRDTAMVNDVLESFAEIAEDFDLDKRIKERTDAYKSAYAAQTNPATGKPYTATEINLLINEEYIREEIAADVMGDVFAKQRMLNDMAGLRPGIIARAYLAAEKVKNFRANSTPEAKAVKRHAKETQSKLLAALEMSGSYEVENGESIVRTSVSDKSWEKQMELGFVALGLRNVDGYTAADYASAREELGDSCFIMKDVPAILQEIGLGKKPLTYTQTHFVNATLPIERNAQGVRVSHAHGIDEDTIARLPKLLSRPAMVLRSRQQSKTSGGMSDAIIIIVDAYDSEGSPVGVVVLPNGEAVVDGVRGAANPILSVYGFEDLNSSDAGRNMLRTARDSNGFLYVNSELTDKMLRKIGQKKSAEPINSPETTGEEYSANEVVANAASRIRSTRRSFSPRPDGLTAAEQPESPSPQRSTSSIKMVSQTERVVNSRYKALAANPYLHGVELDKVTSLTADHDTPASAVRVLPESLMRSEYKSGGELLRWTREGEVWAADETGGGTSYLNMSSPLIIDCGGADATQLGEISGGRGGSIEAIRDYVYASEMQYDGIVLRNLNTDGRVADTAITLTDSQVIPVEPRETVTVGGARYSVTEHEYAPTFYSKLERAIETQKQDKFGANSVVNMLRGKGIKSEEIKWSGVEQFLEGKKSVTKDELLGFLRDNQLQIDTVELSDDLHGQRVVQFSDHDGVLAHARVQDVIGADGGKVLFVGEIQSDRSDGEHSGYTDFVLKNLIRDAAERGYDQIAWTTGAQQKARWSSEYAEGYRIEYDQDIPSFLKKYGKQWGATVGYTVIGHDLTRTGAYRDGGMEAVMIIALNTVDEAGMLSNGAYVVHGMDITDAMKQSVLYDGQPRFSVKASDFGFTGEIRSARGVRLNSEAKRAISSKIMSGDAQIDGIRGTARTFDYEYTFEVYSDGSVEITDVISNEDINRLIESDRRRQKNAERLGSGRSNARRLYTTRPDAGGEADVSERHNDGGRGKRSSETYGREPGRDIPRSGDGEQENTRQTDVDPETEALFSAENAIRFAVSGANMDTLIQNMLRRRVSKVRTNTFKRSGIFTRAELAMEGLREKDMQYNVASEKQSMEDAQQRLTADYEGEKTRLFQNGEEWKPTDLDAAMGVISQELDTARQNGDYREVIKWAQLVRSKGTQAGQLVQAFAKYTRTPEGVLIRAAEDLSRSTLSAKQQKELLDRIAKFSETLEAIQTGDKEALIQLILKQAKQRNTPVSKKTLAAMRADTTDFKFLYDTAITQLDQIAKDYIKTNFGRKVSTFQTLAHLLNLKTAGRNLISNNVFTMVDSLASNAAMMPDLILSAITGQRTVGLDRSRLSKAARAGAQDARNRARIEVALDVAPNDRHDKYGTSRRTWKMSGGKGSQVMSTLEKAMGFELNYTDESAKGAIRAQVIQSLQPFVDNGTITTEEAQQFAEEEARYRTFQDDTALATILGLFKKTLNVVGFGGATPLIKGKALKTHDFGLGDIVVKYTQVPGALITRAFEFSPLGYAKALVNTYKMFEARHELSKRTDISDAKKAELKTEQDLRQRRAALFIGRATTGTGLIAFFAALASAGLLHRGDDEDDPDAKALNTSMGINGTQLNMSALGRWISGESIDWREGDVLASLDFLEPFNSEMAMGTLIARSEEGINAANLAVKSIKALGGAFADLSVMQTLRTIIDTYTYYTPDSGVGIEDEDADKWVTVGLNVALSGATGFVPAPVRQLAQALDDSNRDAYGDRGVWAKTAAQIKNTIPGLRETLPEKLTNFGEPKPAENAFLRAVNAFLMPGTVSTYKPSSAADELADVYNSTDDANIYPDRNAPYKLTITSDGEKTEYALTPEERSTYQRVRGQLSKELIDAARASAAYQQGSAMEKAEMLTTAKNYANYVAKKACLASRGVEYSDATYENYGEMLQSGVDLSSYLAYSAARNDLEADKDDNGDAISGTKKAKTLDLIGSLDMSSGQKSALYFKAYPDEQDEFDDLGIDFDEYYTYSRAMCTLTGDKDANGKTISGSKKAKVVSLIDSLDIPSEAKTKLYLQNGYSAKNIPSWS